LDVNLEAVMRNHHSIERVDAARFSEQFARPLYDSYSFARIPETVQRLLVNQGTCPLPVDTVGGTWKSYDLVVLFFIDGFGWKFFERYAERYPFLNRLLASKITSQFPSTTAAHVTTIHSGNEVGQTGVYEWFYYEPRVDRMIAPLLYAYAGDHQANTLAASCVAPEELYPTDTFYQTLRAAGVDSYVIQQEGIAHTPYSRVLLNGSTVKPYHFWKDGLETLYSLCTEPSSRPRYAYLYFDSVDAMGHRHGIDSPEVADAIDYCFQMLEEQFWQKLQGSNRKIACLVTADHGMVPVNPKTTVYLNHLMPGIADEFKTNREGKPLVPAGSCRDFFLHIREERLGAVVQELRRQLKGIAEVYPTEELIRLGFFGLGEVSELFRRRVGNAVILPYPNEGVYWYEKHRFEQHFYASHGGLTPEEMHSIFLFGEL
jgi:hypothetical protein